MLAPASLPPARKLNFSRMRRRERLAIASRAGNETLSRAPAATKFERRASHPLRDAGARLHETASKRLSIPQTCFVSKVQ